MKGSMKKALPETFLKMFHFLGAKKEKVLTSCGSVESNDCEDDEKNVDDDLSNADIFLNCKEN